MLEVLTNEPILLLPPTPPPPPMLLTPRIEPICPAREALLLLLLVGSHPHILHLHTMGVVIGVEGDSQATTGVVVSCSGGGGGGGGVSRWWRRGRGRNLGPVSKSKW